MNFLQQFRKGLFAFLKYILNPVTRRLAWASFGPFAMVRHVGRRSGKQYETPILVASIQNGFVIELTYGYDVDWHKNVLAAGHCTLIWHGKEYAIDKIEPLDAKTGRAAFPALPRLILQLFKMKYFEKWESSK